MKYEQPYRRLVAIKNQIAQRKHSVNSTLTKFSKKPTTPLQLSFTDKKKANNISSSLIDVTDETDKENSRMVVQRHDGFEDQEHARKEMSRSNSSRGLQHLGQGRVFKKGSVQIDLSQQPGMKEYASQRNLSANRQGSSKSKSQIGIVTESPRNHYHNKPPTNAFSKTPTTNPLIQAKNTLLAIIKRMHNLEIQVIQAQKKANSVLQVSKQMRVTTIQGQASTTSISYDKLLGSNPPINEESIKSEIDTYLIKTQQATTYDGQGKLYNPLFKPTLEMQYIMKIEEQLTNSGSINLQFWKYYKGHFKNSKKHGKGCLILAGDYIVTGEWNNDYLQGSISIYDSFQNLVGQQTLCRPIHTPSIQ